MTAAGGVPGTGIVRALSRIVPSHRRAEWLAEWEGELVHAWRTAARRDDAGLPMRARLAWRAAGAALDAAWMWRRHGALSVVGLDVKYAARSLGRRPGFVTVVVLTLALGGGAAAAVFSVVNGVLLRPLPYADPSRLVSLRGVPTHGHPEKVGEAQSYPDYLDMRAQVRAFSQVAAVRGGEVTFTAPGAEPARLRTQHVTAGIFATLGARPLLGRAFVPGDETPGAPATAILTHAFWQRRFGGDPGVVGTRVQLDGVPTTVVGVLAPETRLSADADVWQALIPEAAELSRATHRLTVIARLREGASFEEAGAQASALAARLEKAYPDENAGRGVQLVPLRDAIVGDARAALLVLFGAVLMVLLIACVNLASLFLARAQAREREMAVRTALGATDGRLVRQWVVESLILCIAGGLAATVVAWGGVRALIALAPRAIPRAEEIALDGTVFLFLLGVSVMTALAFGVLPALQRARSGHDLAGLRDGARTTGGRRRRRVRRSLVVAEVALATVLAVGAGLLVKNLWLLTATDLPLRPDGVVVARVALPGSRYGSPEAVLAFYDRVRGEIAAAPGVRSVSLAYEHPLAEGWTSSYSLADRPQPAVGEWPESRIRPVSPGYFATTGLPLRQGRDISADDRFGREGAVVVNEAFVRRHYPQGDALGKVIDRGQRWWPGQPTTWRIVGVVADEPFRGLRQAADGATYYAHAQFPMSEMWLVVRANGETPEVARLIRDRVRRVDRDLPVEQVASLRDLLGEAVAAPRFNALLLGAFALAALLLAAIGIHGILAMTVAQRTNEIGVRMALGAARGRVVRDVAAEGILLAAGGASLGLAVAFLLARTVRTMLVDVSAQDPAVFAAVPVTLLLVAVAAAWVPARRASRVEPVEALRAG